MPSVLVDVEPAVIDWVIQNTINIKDSKIVEDLSKWKSGKEKPTFKQIETVSGKTHIPLGYFFLKTPPVEVFSFQKCRTITSKNAVFSRDLIDVADNMERIQDWMRNYQITAGYEKLPFVGAAKETLTIEEVVEKFRDFLEVSSDWYKQVPTKSDAFKFFRGKFEDLGILIMTSGIVGNDTHRKLKVEEFRAFTLIDEYAPLIFVNGNDSLGAKLFSLIHEAVHILLGVDNFYNDPHGNAFDVSPTERLCNAVAAEILVPNVLFVEEWTKLSGTSEEKIQELSKTFKCGVVPIARRALDNQYITDSQYSAVSTEAEQQFYVSRKKSGGNYYHTMATRIDNRFLLALDGSVKEGKTLYTDAYRLTNTNRKTFDTLIDTARGIC